MDSAVQLRQRPYGAALPIAEHPSLIMSAPSTPKIVLKSTTKMSLNERFTNMLKNKQPPTVSIRATMQQQQLASARNRRLAQQMENRPSVQAALKLKQSLKQRLGKSNIQARLGRPVGALARGPMVGRGSPRGGVRLGRGGRGGVRGGLSLRGQGPNRGRGGMPRLGLKRGGMRGRGGLGRGGPPGRGGIGGRGAVIFLRLIQYVSRKMAEYSECSAGDPGSIPTTGFLPATGVGFLRDLRFPPTLQRRAGRGGMVGRGRGGFPGRGRGRGRGRGATRPPLTREQLDNQLDAYMSKTKGHLDAELDAYMAQADGEAND